MCCTPSVCLSVCPMPVIYLKSECCRSLKFIEHLMQDTSNLDSHRFMSEWLSGANSERTRCNLVNVNINVELRECIICNYLGGPACRNGHQVMRLLVVFTITTAVYVWIEYVHQRITIACEYISEFVANDFSAFATIQFPGSTPVMLFWAYI